MLAPLRRSVLGQRGVGMAISGSPPLSGTCSCRSPPRDPGRPSWTSPAASRWGRF